MKKTEQQKQQEDKKPIAEIRGMDSRELHGKLAGLRKEQFDLRFRGTESAPRTSRRREIRRTIARILMVLGERSDQAVPSQAGGQQ